MTRDRDDRGLLDLPRECDDVRVPATFSFRDANTMHVAPRPDRPESSVPVLTDGGIVALVREVCSPCECEIGPHRPQECRAAPLDRGWLVAEILDDEQRDRWDHAIAARTARRVAQDGRKVECASAAPSTAAKRVQRPQNAAKVLAGGGTP